jgi:hypothetical protein
MEFSGPSMGLRSDGRQYRYQHLLSNLRCSNLFTGFGDDFDTWSSSGREFWNWQSRVRWAGSFTGADTISIPICGVVSGMPNPEHILFPGQQGNKGYGRPNEGDVLHLEHSLVLPCPCRGHRDRGKSESVGSEELRTFRANSNVTQASRPS